MMKSAKISAITALMLILLFQVSLAASGSTKVTLSKDVLAAGQIIAAGEYMLRWKSSSSEAKITFSNKNGVVAELEATMVERDTASYRDSVLLKPNGKGAMVLEEIRFRGKKYVLVLK